MNLFYEAIDLDNFDLFRKNEGDSETFLFHKKMKIGDYILLYVSQRGIDKKTSKDKEYPIKESGFYGIAKIKSGPKICQKDGDYNKGQEVMETEITLLKKDKPIIPFKVKADPNYRKAGMFTIQF